MNYALIFAGGVGSRMNSKAKPKQFLEIHGKPIIIHTLEHFEEHTEIDAICVVIVEEWLNYMLTLVEKYSLKKVKWVIPGGASALESQYNGLSTIARKMNLDQKNIVLIHDGVRPLIDEKTISNCIRETKKHGSAVTVAPATETIIQTDANNIIRNTFPRTECQLARAPQAFYLDEILAAHNLVKAKGKYDFIDSTSMMLHLGMKIHTVEGPSENIKVTSPADFYICRALMDAKENSQIYGI